MVADRPRRERLKKRAMLADPDSVREPDVRGRPANLLVSTFAARAAVAGIGAIVGVLLARGLGLRGRGEVAFVASLYYVGLLSLNLGYENALLHRQAEWKARPAELRRLGGFIALAAGLAGVAAVFLAESVFAGTRAFSDIRVPWLAMGVGPLPFALDVVYLRTIFQANGRLPLVNGAVIAGAAGQLAVVGGAFVTGRLTVTLALLGSALTVLVPWVLLRAAARSFGPARLSGSGVRRSLAFGLKSSLGISFISLMYRIDFVVVKILLGASVLGLYSVATSVAEALWLLTESVTVVLMSRQVAATRDEAVRVTVRALRGELLVLPVAAVALGAVGVVAIPAAFTSAFRPAVVPMLLLLPGVAAVGAVKPVSLLFVRAGKPASLSLIAASGLTANLAFLFPLAALAGIRGAAIASTLAYGLVAVLYLWWLRSQGVPVVDLIPRAEDVGATVRQLSPARIIREAKRESAVATSGAVRR